MKKTFKKNYERPVRYNSPEDLTAGTIITIKGKDFEIQEVFPASGLKTRSGNLVQFEALYEALRYDRKEETTLYPGEPTYYTFLELESAKIVNPTYLEIT